MRSFPHRPMQWVKSPVDEAAWEGYRIWGQVLRVYGLAMLPVLCLFLLLECTWKYDDPVYCSHHPAILYSPL